MAMEDREGDAKDAFARVRKDAPADKVRTVPPLSDEQKRYRPYPQLRPGGAMRKQADAVDRAVREQEETRKVQERARERLAEKLKNTVEYGSLSNRFNQRSIER